jgi:hypothetical protein
LGQVVFRLAAGAFRAAPFIFGRIASKGACIAPRGMGIYMARGMKGGMNGG